MIIQNNNMNETEITPRNKVLLGRLFATHLVRKFATFVEPEGSFSSE
jgi:hypothetical protein